MANISTNNSASLDQLSDSLKQVDLTGHPPVDQWQPERVGSIDILIKADGTWLHEGETFQRERLVNLFASILWLEDGKHYLKTPAEKLLIQVEEAAFFIPTLDIVDGGTEQQQLVFTTTYGDVVVAGNANRLWVEEDAETSEPAPYLGMRYGMKGKLSRNVFYQLADFVEHAPCPPATETESAANSNETNASSGSAATEAECLFVLSQGVRFNLGAAT